MSGPRCVVLFWAVIKTLYFGFVFRRVRVQLVWFDAKYTILNPRSAIRALTVLVLSHGTKNELIKKKIKEKTTTPAFIYKSRKFTISRRRHVLYTNIKLISTVFCDLFAVVCCNVSPADRLPQRIGNAIN